MLFIICASSFYILLSFITDRINASPVETLTTLPANAANILRNADLSAVVLNDTRRIIRGEDVFSNRPYMVYLKLPTNNPRYKDYKAWLCGGVIVHEEYILTSAACIEDAKHFYIVSGTYKHSIGDDKYNNPCIKNGAKKAVWKCVPRNYIFDGHENDNLRWMNNDIAVVKVEDEFDFTKKIRGCDYVPKPICYNNQSGEFEKPGNEGYIAGWGSLEKYKDSIRAVQIAHIPSTYRIELIILKRLNRFPEHRTFSIIKQEEVASQSVHSFRTYDATDRLVKLITLFASRVKNQDFRVRWLNSRRTELSQDLLDTKVEIMNKNRCKLRWGARYHNIIDNYMICTKDIGTDPTELCNEKYVDCRDIFYESEEEGRRVLKVPKDEVVHSGHLHNTSWPGYRKTGVVKYGGFCENDHGGPLIYGSGPNSVVIGIISACLVKERTNKCYGPFLYTSVWKNRKLINCAIYKNIAPDCAKVFRSSETHEEIHISWADHPDGPAKSELKDVQHSTTPETSTQQVTNATAKQT